MKDCNAGKTALDITLFVFLKSGRIKVTLQTIRSKDKKAILNDKGKTQILFDTMILYNKSNTIAGFW